MGTTDKFWMAGVSTNKEAVTANPTCDVKEVTFQGPYLKKKII